MEAGSDFNTKRSRRSTAAAEEGNAETFFGCSIIIINSGILTQHLLQRTWVWSGSFLTVLKGVKVTIQDHEELFSVMGYTAFLHPLLFLSSMSQE